MDRGSVRGLASKDEIGRTLRRCYSIPTEMTYGRPSDHDVTGVAEAMNHLNVTEIRSSRKTSPKWRRSLPNFLARNRAAVQGSPQVNHKPRSSHADPDDVVHGIIQKKCPPIKELLTENHLHSWINEQNEKRKKLEEMNREIQYGASRRYGYADTRTTALRQLNRILNNIESKPATTVKTKHKNTKFDSG